MPGDERPGAPEVTPALASVVPRSLRSGLRGLARRLRYAAQRARRRPAGTVRYEPVAADDALPPLVEVRLPAEGPDAVTEAAAGSWSLAQTLVRTGELAILGVTSTGVVRWRIGTAPSDGPAEWFAAPGGLPALDPAHLESCLLVAAAEAVDSVAIAGEAADDARWNDLTQGPLRAYTLYSSRRFDAVGPDPVPRPGSSLAVAKILDGRWGGEPERTPSRFHATRRGAYRTDRDAGPELVVGVRDAAEVLRRRRPSEDGRTPVLVLAPFLATGGAEHTLYETLAVLRPELDLTIATLAPHAPERGDRRADFRRLTDRLLCLGDLVHPAAMEGILAALLDVSGARVIYNANGTTLFYELGPRLKRRYPNLRIVDHLYDHRIGYVEWYTPEVRGWVDACVAENRRVQRALVDDRGWPAERVPVIWPCGRPRDAFPRGDRRDAVRERLRAELGIPDDAVVLLTAARMHEQKRPLDLVRLAERVRDLEQVRFLIVGGGPLEGDVDRAIAGSDGRIARLGFRDDVPELIVAADAGCLVSDYEGLPVFLLECLQGGRPFVGTDVGDLGDLLRETGAGIVVDRPGDLEALETAVRRIADPDARRQLAARAAAAGDRFDPVHCAAAYRAALLGA